MSRHGRTLLMLLLVVAVFAGAMWMVRRGQPAGLPQHVMKAVPAEAQVVVTANLHAIRQGPYRQLILSDAVPSLVGGSDGACQTQVVDRLGQLAIWTSSSRPDELGIVAMGDFTEQAFWQCAERTIEQRGGKASSRMDRGFRIIVDDTLGSGSAQLAVRSPGLLLVGPEGARSDMMEALERDVGEGNLHGSMRGDLGLEGDVVLSAFVGEGIKRKIARIAEAPTPVLDQLDRVAAAVQLGAMTNLQVLLWCRTGQACGAIADQLELRRDKLSRSLPMRAAGVASLVQQVRVERQGARLRVSVQAPSAQVLEVLQRVRELEAATTPPGAGDRGGGPAADETVRVGPGAAGSERAPGGAASAPAGSSGGAR